MVERSMLSTVSKAKIVRLLLIGVLIGCGITLGGGTSAYAACNAQTGRDHYKPMASFQSDCKNIIPASPMQGLRESYYTVNNGNGWANMYEAWISPAGNPTGTEVVVDAATTNTTTTVALQLNIISYRKRGNDRVEFKRHILSSNNPTLATMRGNAGVTVTYPTSTENYRIMQPIQFNHIVNPAAGTNTLVTITTKQKAVNRLTSGFACVSMFDNDPRGGMGVSGINAYSGCSEGSSSFPIRVLVRSAWRTAGDTRLYSRAPGAASFALRATNGSPIVSLPPGTDAYWNHSLRLTSGTVNERNWIGYTRQRTGPAGFATTTTRVNWSFGTPGSSIVAPSSSLTTALPGISSQSAPFRIQLTHVGQTFCERLNWDPTQRSSGATSGSASTQNTCFRVPYNPNLTPHIEVEQPDGSLSRIIVPGIDTLRVVGSIRNSGTTNEYPTTVGIARFVQRTGGSHTIPQSSPGLVPGQVDPGGAFMCRDTASSPGIVRALTNQSVQADCATLHSQVYPKGTVPTGAGLLAWHVQNFQLSDVPGLTLGDRVCFVMALNRYNASASDRHWRHSGAICLTIAKIPSAQVSGGDLAVRGTLSETQKTIRGHSYLANSLRYGSWAEYGVFGPSNVEMHSAGSLANANTNPSTAQKNALVFANNGAGTPGRFSVPTTAASIATYDWSKLGITTGASIGGGSSNNVRDGGPGLVRTYGAGTTRISGATIPQGESYIIRAPNGTIRITGNITYSQGPYSSMSDLPQVVIIARNIVIDEAVTNIDAWLVATGTETQGVINTCGLSLDPSPNYFSGLSSNMCTQKLRINGVVQANRLFMRRTHGADSKSLATRDADLRRPAEVFNARSDAYLWAHSKAASQGVVRTESVRELPPRF